MTYDPLSIYPKASLQFWQSIEILVTIFRLSFVLK